MKWHVLRRVKTAIDREKCIGCCACVAVCPMDTISIENGKASITGHESLSCGHCVAACPVGAVKVDGIDEQTLKFNTFQMEKSWIPHGDFPISNLVRVIASRRSCRNFSERPVDKGMLEDLVKIGIMAPSGTNSQSWAFTVLTTRRAVVDLAERVAAFYKKVNKRAEIPWLRKLFALFGMPELEKYYLEYYRTVEEALLKWERNGVDLLFHGATAAIVVSCKHEASCPAEDALLATQNILIGAHCLGLGSCLIGFASEAIKRDPSIKRALEIPDDEEVYAVIALGYPSERYVSIVGRKKPVIRFV